MDVAREQSMKKVVWEIEQNKPKKHEVRKERQRKDYLLWSQLEKVINETIPRDLDKDDYVAEPAQWWADNDNTFRLAQALKGVEGFAILSSQEQREVVWKWYKKWESILCGRNGDSFEFEEVWDQLVNIWDKVKYPKGRIMEGLLKKARELLLKNEPQEIDKVTVNRYKILVPFCYLCQLQSKGEGGYHPFYLSQSTAGKLIKRSTQCGSFAIKHLIDKKVISFVKRGHPGKGSLYWYNGFSTKKLGNHYKED